MSQAAPSGGPRGKEPKVFTNSPLSNLRSGSFSPIKLRMTAAMANDPEHDGRTLQHQLKTGGRGGVWGLLPESIAKAYKVTTGP